MEGKQAELFQALARTAESRVPQLHVDMVSVSV
jgi:hypothetical protein